MALTTRKANAFNNPSNAPKRQTTPFLSKLYAMVNDPSTESLIRWSETGDSFYVYDHERFAKEVLPHWFKHGNFGSFVRQLNNYGFHKVPHLQQGVLRSDGENEISHFENENFKRGQFNLLFLIQRKKQMPNEAGEEPLDYKEPVASSSAQANGAESESTHSSNNVKGAVLDINGVVTGIQAIKRHQHAISAELKELHQSNQGLWQEAFAARERHKKHHDTITRILKFLAGVFGQTGGGSPHPQEVPHDAQGDSSNAAAIVPRRQNRLMIENGVDLAGKAAEVLNGMHLNMSDFMEPLDFEGGQANDGDRFATIETPGSPVPSPGPSTPKQKPSYLPSAASSPQAFPSQIANTTPDPINPSAAYPFLPSVHNQLSTDISQDIIPDFPLSSDASSSILGPNTQPDQMMQNAFTSLLDNPSQLQRVLAALQSQMPVSMPPDPGPDNTRLSREAMSPPPSYNFRPPPDGQLSPGSTLSLLSAVPNMGGLSLSSGDDPTALNALAQGSNQLQKSYKDAAEVEADVNTLQGHIDSLIQSLNLEPSMAAALRGEQHQQQQQHQQHQQAENTDDEIVSSTAATGLPVPPPRLTDESHDFDFDAYLSQDFDAGAGLGGLLPGTAGFDAAIQQSGAERLGAFLDEVRSVSNESETAGSVLDNEPSVDTQDTVTKGTKKGTKRKSAAAELGDDVQPAPKTSRTKTA
ncbi:hypothetical protein JB92DRAFT_2984747 [Gautieria morchelliformis]|nr:hypothetical protein JB92DRAFT_2984747 [Gautieria morchelliformis]